MICTYSVSTFYYVLIPIIVSCVSPNIKSWPFLSFHDDGDGDDDDLNEWFVELVSQLLIMKWFCAFLHPSFFVLAAQHHSLEELAPVDIVHGKKDLVGDGSSLGCVKAKARACDDYLRPLFRCLKQ